MNLGILLAGATLGLATGAVADAQTAAAPPAAAQAPAGAASAAPAAAGITQGATVTDPQGSTVGTVESIDGDFVVLATAKSKVRLPKSSFAIGQTGPVIAMTAAQIDQAAAQAAPPATAAAATAPKVVKGASVVGINGGAIGTVSEADAQFATVDLASGGKVRLPISSFGAGANGALRIAMTADQLTAAAAAAGATTQK